MHKAQHTYKTGKIKTTDCLEEQEHHDSYNNVMLQWVPDVTEDTPLSALAMAALAEKAGIPAGISTF